MASWIASAADGVILAVKVTPRARKTAIELPASGAELRVRVTAPPVDGKANVAVLSLLAETFDIPKSALSIVSGETSRSKRILVRGDTTILVQRLGARGAAA